MKHNFKAGKYWIGDPCYAIKDENWIDVLEKTGYFGAEEIGDTGIRSDGSFYYNGGKCFCSGTKYGDGTYFDQYMNEYGVDAGLLGILPFDICDGDTMEGGNLVIFDQDFKVHANDGDFYFGHIHIDTDDSNFDENDYYE